MEVVFDDFEVYRMNLLAKAIKEIDDKLNVLSEETRTDIDNVFQYVEE